MRIRHSSRRASHKTFGQIPIGAVFSWANANNVEQRYLKTRDRECFSFIANQCYSIDNVFGFVIEYDAELVLAEIVG